MQPGYPGYGYGYGMPMVPQKSATPRTLGTLSMTFGGIIAALNLIGVLAGKQFNAMMKVEASQQEAFDQYLREVHNASLALGVVMLVMSIALFVIGTGQRGYKRWAVTASVAWGIAALVFLVINLFVQLTVILPALDRFIEAISHGNMPGQMNGIMKVSALLGLAFYAPYPIILIVAFRRPHNIQAMDQPPEPTPAAGVF
jgi:hypothetical protein